jgi:hypothetical protein
MALIRPPALQGAGTPLGSLEKLEKIFTPITIGK